MLRTKIDVSEEILAPITNEVIHNFFIRYKEQAAIETALQKAFKLSDEQLTKLIDLAEQENRNATSLYQFTNLIKDEYSLEQRFQLVKMLWQVAMADGDISKYEDHLIRKIADLIYLPHSQFIQAKLAIMGDSELGL